MTELHEVARAMLHDYRAWLTKQSNPNRTLANARAFVDRDPFIGSETAARRDACARELHRESGRIPAQPSADDLRAVREFLALVETSVTTPDADTLRALREQLGMTQAQAAEVMRVNLRTWQKWELGERTMSAALFELFLIKTGA